MPELRFQRCRNHEHREAIARCPECGRFFCRECIIEHEDRVLCTVCLHRLIDRSASPRKRSLRGLVRILQLVLGVFVLWMFFFYLGQALLSIPTSFHEGTIWQTKWWENP
ncbi:MAG: rhomboid family protein [Deltaproteobacteria bacterium]|nr:MAG: rhomboid family protein [Deltaproteobacteria bacterium]